MTKNYTAIDEMIASSSKESEPILAPYEIPETKENLVEQSPEKDVKNFITIHPETIELPPNLKKLGLKTPPSSVTAQYNNIKLPISDEKIVAGLNAPITSSIKWLSTLAVYILRQSHLGLKIIHGHVVRVIRR